MTLSKGNILIIDDDIDVLETARMFLKQYYTRVDISPDPTKIPGIISKNHYDVILLDMNFRKGRNDGVEGFYWLDRILEYDPEAVVILITAYGEIDLAVKAIKEGATDFVLKPWKNQKLLGTVMSGWKLRMSKIEVKKLKDTARYISRGQNNGISGIIGKSTAMLKVFDLIKKVSATAANVLILGENGTGKELVARAVHEESDRKDNQFIKVDMGAMPETLIESELFGHVKGAYTDAKEARTGSFELASGGTIFLDEIGNISLNAQAKILTVLENRIIKKIGSNIPFELDVRIVAATNNLIYDMVNEGSFRQDLLYRLNTVEIFVPPLRDRKDDVPLLTDHYFTLFSIRYKKQGVTISSGVIEKLINYNWPGNVRELQHAVERAVILNDNNVITDSELFIQKQEQGSVLSSKTIHDMEKNFILHSLKENGGNVTQTAKVIGLTRTALYRRLHKYGI